MNVEFYLESRNFLLESENFYLVSWNHGILLVIVESYLESRNLGIKRKFIVIPNHIDKTLRWWTPRCTLDHHTRYRLLINWTGSQPQKQLAKLSYLQYTWLPPSLAWPPLSLMGNGRPRWTRSCCHGHNHMIKSCRNYDVFLKLYGKEWDCQDSILSKIPDSRSRFQGFQVLCVGFQSVSDPLYTVVGHTSRPGRYGNLP